MKDIPLPGKKTRVTEEIFPLQVRVNKKLYASVKKAAKDNNVSVKELVEWGIKTYLLRVNPEAAKKLGLG